MDRNKKGINFHPKCISLPQKSVRIFYRRYKIKYKINKCLPFLFLHSFIVWCIVHIAHHCIWGIIATNSKSRRTIFYVKHKYIKKYTENICIPIHIVYRRMRNVYKIAYTSNKLIVLSHIQYLTVVYEKSKQQHLIPFYFSISSRI